MATLTDDEIDRIKFELLDDVVGQAAEPYFGIQPLFTVIRDNVSSSATAATTSSTAVTSALVAAGGVEIAVATASGLAVNTRVQLDVDTAREVCLVRSVLGTTIGVNARKPHAGTYPVEIESGLTIVRGLLSDLAYMHDTRMFEAWQAAGLKRVDEVEWFGPSDGRSLADEMTRVRDRLRWELASAVGLRNLFAKRAGAGARYEAY